MSNSNKKQQPRLNRTQVARLRVKDLRRLLPGGELDMGNHEMNGPTPDGVCLMEAVAWVAGEPHSDHPKCACPVLTDIGIEINDSTDSEGRQRLIPAIPALIGSKTASKRARFKRAKFATQRVLAASLDAMDFTGKDYEQNYIRLFARKVLSGARGRSLTKDLTKRLIDALEFLEGEDDMHGDHSDLISMLKGLHGAWDSDGIDFHDYESILGDVRYSAIIPDEKLPEFFVDLATTHA